MTGKRAGNICPLCGGALEAGSATIPFILKESIVIVKHVPSQICVECREPFLTGRETDVITDLLTQVKELSSEVTVLTFPEPAFA
ncbi:MAG: YgiT-type zinc finger protein [Chloroflexi bacterium]|nr:YgiT-type zinc finger protein [Chloroflexota bacterium]